MPRTSNLLSKRIVSVVPNPRKKGTKAHRLYAEMAKFVGRRKPPVPEVLENTRYRLIDLKSDQEHEYVKLG